MEKIYVIDAVNFIFRSYFAIGPMTNSQGQSTNALFGFIRSLNKIIKDFSPTHLIAVFDGPDNKKSRTDMYSEYKAHRTGMPEDLFPQLEEAVKYCEMASIPTLTVPGVEADDTMGSIAKWAEQNGKQVYLCTSDKDMCQLVSDQVFVLNVFKDNLVIDKQKVKEIYGIEAEQMVDLLAMMGDASDNIPGLEGFGLKTAAGVLSQFGTLEYILEHPDCLSGKKREVVIRDREVALLSKRLATIHVHVDFPKNETFFQLKEPDLESLKHFYREMNFMSLLKEIETVPTQPEEPSDYQLIDNEDYLKTLIEDLSKEKAICLDTETTNIRPIEADVVGIGLSVHPRKAYYVPLNGKLGKTKVLAALKPLLENPKIGFCGHNIKYDLHVLLNEGIHVAHIDFDTLIASWLIAPQNQKHSLDELALSKFSKVKIPIEELIGKGKKQITMDQAPIEKVSEYCCEDVDYTCRLKKLFEGELESEELMSILKEIELPLIPVLMKMERYGVYVDLEKLKSMSHNLNHLLRDLEHRIFSLAGMEFNLNSPKQLGNVLFESLGIPAPKKTTTGYSTAADVLESLKGAHPIVKAILEYRVLEKLRSTYVDALPSQISPKTGRIHCSFNQAGTATGRLSCQDPNLQNIPIRTEMGRQIREAFKPERPGWSFLSADYSQIELRLLAHLSEDPSLIKAFNQGEDIHAFTASLVFNVPLEEVTSEMRHKAKAVNFGIIYGQQAFGLSQGLDIDYKEAAKFIETYFQRYPKVKEFFDFCKESVRQTGRSVTLTGRKRPIPEISSHNSFLRSQSERLAMNTPLQGTAADLIKLAMIEIDKLLEHRKDLGFMVLQIHDELLFEVPDDKADELASHVKKIMENVFTLKVPLVVDISIGKNWGEC